MNPFKAYLRWRHSKGFGVHSQYAYRFVTDVLHPGPYGYYAYLSAEKLLGEKSIYPPFCHYIKFIIRLAVFLNTKRIISPVDVSELTGIVATALNLPFVDLAREENFNSHPGDLLIIHTLQNPIETITNAITRSTSVLALDPDDKIRRELERPRKKGLLISRRDMVFFTPRPEMEYAAYEM